MKNVCILNLGYSNIKSVMGAFQEIDIEATVIEKIDSVEINAPLVLPGVGAFGGAMQRLTFGDTGHYLNEAYKKNPKLNCVLSDAENMPFKNNKSHRTFIIQFIILFHFNLTN